MGYQIYNKSGHAMDEVASNSVDLILTSPCYNANAWYGDWHDACPMDQFFERVNAVVGECTRVLKPDGRFIVECADTVLTSTGDYISLGAIFSKQARVNGLSLVERHCAFIQTHNGVELPEHNWSDDFVAQSATHSNAHQIQVFQKGHHPFQPRAGQIMYYNYPADEEGHPTPFGWPLVHFVLDRYFKPGQVALDPYAGTARFGREVLKRGGSFIGYDINADYCRIAEGYLSQV